MVSYKTFVFADERGFASEFIEGENPLTFRFEERLVVGEMTEKPVPMLGVDDVVDIERVVVVDVEEDEEAPGRKS